MNDKKETMTLEQRIAEKVGNELVDLIPQEEWQSLVAEQVKLFKRDTAPRMIQDAIKAKLQNALKDELNKSIYSASYLSNGEVGGSDAMLKIIEESAPQILAMLIGGSMQSVLEAFKSNLQYSNQYGVNQY